MGATMEIAIFRIEGRRNPPAKHRVEIGRIPPERKSRIPVVLTQLYREQPEDPWRVCYNVCYPAEAVLAAIDDMRRIIYGHRAAGEPCEDNLDQVEIAVPPARPEVIAEVCGDRKPAA